MDKRRMKNKPESNNTESSLPIGKSLANALKELIKDTAFSKYRKTLEDLQKYVLQVNETEKKWTKKCQTLETEILANASKIKAAIQLSEEDNNTIETLKGELKQSWDVIEQLKGGNDNGNVCMRSQHSYGNDHNSLNSFRNESYGKKESILSYYSQSSWKLEKEPIKYELGMQKEMLQKTKTELEASTAKCEKLNKEIKRMNISIQNKDETISKLKNDLNNSEAELVRVKESKQSYNHLTTELKECKVHVFELVEELANKEKIIEEMTSDIEIKNKRLIDLETEIVSVNEMLSFKELSKTIEHTKPVRMATEKNDLKSKRKLEILAIKINNMSLKDLQTTHKLRELFDSNEKLSRSVTNLKNEIEKLRGKLKEKDREFEHLLIQSGELKNKQRKQCMVIKELEKVRSTYAQSIANLENYAHELKKQLAMNGNMKHSGSIETLNIENLELKKENVKMTEENDSLRRMYEEKKKENNKMLENIRNNNENQREILKELDNNEIYNEYLRARVDFGEGRSITCHDKENLISPLKYKLISFLQYLSKNILQETEEHKLSSDSLQNEMEEVTDAVPYEKSIFEEKLSDLDISLSSFMQNSETDIQAHSSEESKEFFVGDYDNFLDKDSNVVVSEDFNEADLHFNEINTKKDDGIKQKIAKGCTLFESEQQLYEKSDDILATKGLPQPGNDMTESEEDEIIRNHFSVSSSEEPFSDDSINEEEMHTSFRIHESAKDQEQKLKAEIGIGREYEQVKKLPGTKGNSIHPPDKQKLRKYRNEIKRKQKELDRMADKVEAYELNLKKTVESQISLKDVEASYASCTYELKCAKLPK